MPASLACNDWRARLDVINAERRALAAQAQAQAQTADSARARAAAQADVFRALGRGWKQPGGG